jgi:hypothetical protein
MKYYLLFFTLLAILACKDKDDDNPSIYPINYTFSHIDQTDEGLYLLNAGNTLTSLPTDVGLYGAYKDSLKTTLQETVIANLELEGVEIVDEDDIKFHFVLQGHDFITPVKYTTVNGEIVLNDTIQSGIVSYDASTDHFVLCGATPFALPGPNAINPFGPPYLQFNVQNCIVGHENRDYAIDYMNANALQVQDTIGVLLTKYLFAK